jgi:hypothetical protein
MDKLMKAAIEAAKQGDKNKAIELIKQSLNSNPNDIDALLVLAAIVDESTRKRQILNRVLSLDSTNKTAREMMLKLDRAEINTYFQPSSDTSTSKPQSISGIQPISQDTNSNQISTTAFDKPRTFQYPAGCMAVLYVFTVISCCGTLWFAAVDMSYSFPFLVLFLLMTLGLGYFLATTSSRVETDDKGIRVVSRFRTVEMKWNEIINVKIDALRGTLILKSSIGETAKISTYIQGYRIIMEVLQAKRFDLYTEATQSHKQSEEMFTESVSSKSNSHRSTNSASDSNMSTPKPRKEKTLVFRYPLFWRIFMFSGAAFFGCIGLLIATVNVVNGLPFLVIAIIVIIGIASMGYFQKVEITDDIIRGSSTFTSAEARWDEITSMKSSAYRLMLTKSNGEVVHISKQVSKYSDIVEIMRLKRPDIFGLVTQTGKSGGSVTVSKDAFTGTRTFEKGFIGKYGMIVLTLIVILPFGAWYIFQKDIPSVLAVIVAGLLVFIITVPFNITRIELGPNKLITESFLGEKEYIAREIKEISIKTVRGRGGMATNFIKIQPIKGRGASMAGFPEGDEIIYGTLINWWETYRNR